MYRILVVEDDTDIATNLTDFLETEGFAADSADGQHNAFRLLETQPYDLVLLDVSLKDGNGFSICTAIKSRWDTPVIFLTASGDEYSTITGLELGAEDYIAKPFRPRELISRMKNALRRKNCGLQPLEYENVSVDIARACVRKEGCEIPLSALEYRLLLYFFHNRGQVLSRNQLLQEIWDAAGEFVNDNTLTVYIKRLREKLEDDPANPRIIRTIRGFGYQLG